MPTKVPDTILPTTMSGSHPEPSSELEHGEPETVHLATDRGMKAPSRFCASAKLTALPRAASA